MIIRLAGAVPLAALVLGSIAMASPAQSIRIASWYGNRDAAVSLRFDDGLESHITTVIPLLTRYGIRATFLVNPGLERYQEHREFWEKTVPAMGHRLGNHTMNHRGARDLEDAEYEIGEASRTIWSAYPRESRLLVFASGGGGKEWGGKLWEQADPLYHALVHKYHLIDLYDGTHPYISVRAGMRAADLCRRLDATLDAHKHQVFAFHQIGAPSISESVKAMVRGYGLTLEAGEFEAFLQCLNEHKQRIWIAPLIDVLKYQEEAKGAVLRVLRSGPQRATLQLTVRTEPVLYDHPLTLVLPSLQGRKVRSIRQDAVPRAIHRDGAGGFSADVLPENSTITVVYGGK